VVQPILIPLNEQLMMLIDKRNSDEKGCTHYNDSEIQQVADSLDLLGDFFSSLQVISSQT
jgi:hypothetical protein